MLKAYNILLKRTNAVKELKSKQKKSEITDFYLNSHTAFFKLTWTALFKKQLFSPGALVSPFERIIDVVFLGWKTRDIVDVAIDVVVRDRCPRDVNHVPALAEKPASPAIAVIVALLSVVAVLLEVKLHNVWQRFNQLPLVLESESPPVLQTCGVFFR